MMQVFLVSLGLGVAAATFVAILWSIAFPAYRLWPPKRYTTMTPVLVWVPTLMLSGVLLVLGIMEWRSIDVPNWLRFGFGVPPIVAGNIVVWSEVAHFGIPQTGGAKGSLRTAGMYRYSRNPQYVADIAIVGGWITVSASESVAVVGLAGIAILIAAPFAEEPWLQEQYGSAFQDYMRKVRRFL